MITFIPSGEIFFRDLPFDQRIQNFASLGFEAYEIWWQWKKDIDVLLRANAATGMRVHTLCSAKVALTERSRHEEARDALRAAIEAARKLACTRVVTYIGNEVPGETRAAQRQSVIDGLKMSADIVEREGMTLLVEPLSLLDHQGYFLSRSDEARAILEAVGSKSVRMLFDIYHQQVSEGNVIQNIRDHYDFIGHFQAADSPGRHEPGTGELNYPNILRAIAELGYRGPIGLELLPTDPDHARVLTGLKQELEAVFADRRGRH